MSDHTKARLWAVAGAVPAVVVAGWVGGPVALLITAALFWAWVTAVLSEHAWQTPTVKWLERRNAQLEKQQAATEAAMRVMARRQARAEAGIVDLREDGTLTRAAEQRQTELRRRLEETAAARWEQDALERARLHAEPTPAEIDEAKADIVRSFGSYDDWGSPR